jgi:predicted acylesterase/phospholipase RssA
MIKNAAPVLSSGGARGYAHIGAIKVLEQQGFLLILVPVFHNDSSDS